jgi:hypothetical protein
MTLPASAPPIRAYGGACQARLPRSPSASFGARRALPPTSVSESRAPPASGKRVEDAARTGFGIFLAPALN